MSTNLAEFNKELGKLTKDFTEDKLVEFHKIVTFEAYRRIVIRTPVDTGRARMNWQIGFDEEPKGVIDVNVDTKKGKKSKPNATVGIDASTALKLTASIKPFSISYITNNVYYIWYLEYTRRSRQSPDGMVEITLQELTNEFRSYDK